MDKKIYVTKSTMPDYEEYIKAIKPLWESRWLTNMGIYHELLEKRLRDYLTVPYVSLMVNGHMAIELALQAFGFPLGSEVITTPFTFVSTTHAIVRNGLTPVFCDIKLEDGTIDENKIEDLITEKTVAILPVHVYGHVCNVNKIEEIASKYNLKVIYDAAHSFGVKYKGIGIGNYGDASCFSFHATKIFNTIEGGAVTFKDELLYNKLYNLKNFGIRDEELVVDIGANAKMNEFAAIMGLCNLNHIEETFAHRKSRFNYYVERLKSVPGIIVFDEQNDVEHNYAYMPVVIRDDYRISRNEIYTFLQENDVCARKYFYPLTSDQACFKNRYMKADLKKARYLSDRILALPFYETIEYEVIDKIIELLRG